MAAPCWRLILNGKSAGNDELRDAIGHCRQQGVQLQVRVTWEDGDVERYAAEAIDQGVAVIIAGGGDGTLNAVAATLARHEASAQALPALALVPLGTANDFAGAAGFPAGPGAALELIVQQPAMAIDLLRVDADGHRRWCINLASGGFGTEVTRQTDAGLKQMLGGLAYVFTGITRLGRIEAMPASVQGPDFHWQGNFIALAIGNGRQAGGGQPLCPQALIDDGLLDLSVIGELDGELATTLGQALTSGAQAALEPHLTRARLPWLELHSPVPLTLNLDGEPVSGQRFRIDCVPGRVRMHLPADCPLLR